MNQPGTPDNIAAIQRRYQDEIRRHESTIEKLQRQWKFWSLVRGFSFLASIALLICGLASLWQLRTTWFWASATVFVGFLVVVFVHDGIDANLKSSRIWLRLKRWSRARWRRDWQQLKYEPPLVPDEFNALASDLDLFGESSLFQLLGDVESPLGVELLRQWLFYGADVSQIERRQQAVRQLAKCDSFRERLRYLCHILSAGDGGPRALLAWAEAPKQVDRRGILVALARFLAAAMAVALLAVLTGIIPLTAGGPLLMILLTLNFFMTVIFAGRIHGLFNQVSTRHGEINHYIQIIRLIEKQKFDSPLLAELSNELFDPAANVLQGTSRLGTIAWMANLRRHGFLFIAYLFLQFLFLWDFHVLNLLQRWKRAYGGHVRNWLANLAQWEVLAVMAQLSVDHPDWAFPAVQAADRRDAQLVAKAIGHPLLPNSTRVYNDVTVGPPGSVLLVTGSNMSGKSTLLRAIGVNAVLAQMGAPVCAAAMAMSPVRIETSMRIVDSLAEGVSFFMAELKRLKQIVDVAAHVERDPRVTVLFLLDEILQGTNSRERHIAVTRVIKHLIDHRAIGAVSTHDLELGHTAELADACRPVHFRESFAHRNGRKEMTFDYRLHQGLATTTNALELLKMVGLDEPDSGQ